VQTDFLSISSRLTKPLTFLRTRQSKLQHSRAVFTADPATGERLLNGLSYFIQCQKKWTGEKKIIKKTSLAWAWHDNYNY